MGAVIDRLAAAGHTVPTVAPPLAAYVPAVRTGNLIFTAGQLPLVDGAIPRTGKVGAEVTAEQAAELAEVCALNAIAALTTVLEDLDDVVRIVKAVVFVASAPDFAQQPVVANGASNLLREAFGDSGIHARSAVGVAVLPLDAPVEVELVVEVR